MDEPGTRSPALRDRPLNAFRAGGTRAGLIPAGWRRWGRFNAVGAAGIVVQALVLTLLVRGAHIHYLVATALAVEAAVLHNFAWHRHWTWADRRRAGPVPESRQRVPGLSDSGTWNGPGLLAALRALLRFNLTTGAFSITGNLVFMRLLGGAAGLDPVLANLLSIALCSILNFLISDRFVFV